MSKRQNLADQGRAVAAPGLLRLIAALIRLWWHRHCSRRRLAEMDARMLRDIGVSRLDAREEARKWFWQP